jgi:NADH dehydrogenase/NADH:ubiquinone oxidoreductase subunit G
MRTSSGHRRSRGAWIRVSLVFATAATVVTLAGCSSGKPAYCTDRTNLQNSVKGLTSLNTSSGVSGLQSQVKQIQSNATTLVNSAKSDFPSETSAITSSVNALKSAVAALSSSPSAAQIATVTKDAASVVSSVKNFMDASNSKCS